MPSKKNREKDPSTALTKKIIKFIKKEDLESIRTEIEKDPSLMELQYFKSQDLFLSAISLSDDEFLIQFFQYSKTKKFNFKLELVSYNSLVESKEDFFLFLLETDIKTLFLSHEKNFILFYVIEFGIKTVFEAFVQKMNEDKLSKEVVQDCEGKLKNFKDSHNILFYLVKEKKNEMLEVFSKVKNISEFLIEGEKNILFFAIESENLFALEVLLNSFDTKELINKRFEGLSILEFLTKKFFSNLQLVKNMEKLFISKGFVKDSDKHLEMANEILEKKKSELRESKSFIEEEKKKIKEEISKKKNEKLNRCDDFVLNWLKEAELEHLETLFGSFRVKIKDIEENHLSPDLLEKLDSNEKVLLKTAIEQRIENIKFKKREIELKNKRKKKLKKLLRHYGVSKEEDLPEGVAEEYLRSLEPSVRNEDDYAVFGEDYPEIEDFVEEDNAAVSRPVVSSVLQTETQRNKIPQNRNKVNVLIFVWVLCYLIFFIFYYLMK